MTDKDGSIMFEINKVKLKIEPAPHIKEKYTRRNIKTYQQIKIKY